MAGGLVDLAREDPDRTIVTDGTVEYSCAAFNERVNRLIDANRKVGVSIGDAIAVLATNRADYLTVTSAASLGGVSPVPVNVYLQVDEVAYILDNAGVRALFVGPEQAEVGRKAAERAGVPVVVTFGDDLERHIATGDDVEPSAETPYASPIYYTSGTTGRPKGTRMSQVPTGVPVPAVLRGLKEMLVATGLDSSTVHLVQGPLYHAAPLGVANFTLIVGGTCHVMPHFEPEEALRWIERHGVTSSIMVPTMFVRLLRLPEEVRNRYDVSSLELVIHTGAIMPVDVKRQMIDWWGGVLVDGYGASELGVVCQIGSEEWLHKPGSVGRPLPTFTIEILAEDGSGLPPGDIGQVFITSLTDADISYIGEPEKTASVHRGHKQFTLGDMGWLDEDGYLFLADRRSDMIVSGGVNVYPAETEAALLAHPAVEDVGVFGVPDPEWGQQVRAAVQLRTGHVASDELERQLIDWLRERVAHYKVPRSIDFHETLPRFPNGKLHRRVLRDPFWADTSV